MSNDVVNFNSGFAGCNDRMAILRNEVVPRRIEDNDKFEEIKNPQSLDSGFLYVDRNGENCKVSLAKIVNGASAVQADWDETDTESMAYIKNKPDISSIVLQEDLTTLYNVGGIAAGETFKEGTNIMYIIQKLLSVNPDYTLYYGVFDVLPTKLTSPEDPTSEFRPNVFYGLKSTKEDLLTSGFTWENATFENQYYVIVIPDFLLVELDRMMTSGFELETFKDEEFNNNTCISYFYNKPVTGTYTFECTFKNKE